MRNFQMKKKTKITINDYAVYGVLWISSEKSLSLIINDLRDSIYNV